MREKLYFVRLPLLLVALFFVGRLTLGAAGASYEVGNRLFSMVILQTHLALLWAAVGRRYRGYLPSAANCRPQSRRGFRCRAHRER